MKKSYLSFMFAALGIASLQAATPEPDYSYIAINGSTVQISDYQKAINQGLTTKISLYAIASARANDIVKIRAWQTKDNDAGEQGTGFYVGPDFILTCYHVVKGASRIEILDAHNHLIANATLRNWNEKCDVADLTADRPHSTWCNLDPDSSWEKRGEGIVTAGFPDQQYNEQQGTVAKCWTEAKGRDTAVFEISPFLQGGASGSPVLNEYGVVIGMAFANTARNSTLVVSMNAVWEALRLIDEDHPNGFVTGITDNLDLRFQNRELPQPQTVQQQVEPQGELTANPSEALSKEEMDRIVQTLGAGNDTLFVNAHYVSVTGGAYGYPSPCFLIKVTFGPDSQHCAFIWERSHHDLLDCKIIM
jgi:hypothetical protein